MSTPTENSVQFVMSMNAKFNNRQVYGVKAGRVYDKVVRGENGGSVEAFIDRVTGDVYKPAGWAAPAKGIRGNVATQEGMVALVTKADQYGGYLYKY